MAQQENPDSSLRVLAYHEQALFPDGQSSILNSELYDDRLLTIGYLSDYPGFDVDITTVPLLQAKLAAVASVRLDRDDGVPTRPDLARVISDRNYSPGYILAVSQNALARRVFRGKERALSERTIDRYAQAYGEEGVAGLAADTARLALATLHLDTATGAADLDTDVLTFIDENGLEGARRMIAGLNATNKKILTADEGVDIYYLDKNIQQVIEIINRVGRQALGGRALDAVVGFGEKAALLRDMRINPFYAELADSQDSRLIVNGSNAEMLQEAVVVLPKREEVTTSRPTAEAIRAMQAQSAEEAERRRAEQQLELEQQEIAEAERVAAIDAANEPILERINHIAEEYDQLANVVYGCSRKVLREKYVFGQDSVLGRMLPAFQSSSKESLEDAARLYAGLAVNAREITTNDELKDWVERVNQQRAQYDAVRGELLPGGSSYDLPELGTDISSDLLWLDTNFEELYVTCIADCRSHVQAVGDGAIDRVIRLLGRDGEAADTSREEEIEEAAVSDLPEAAEIAAPPSLAEVRAMAETVDWTIMPGEAVTKEDLRKVIEDTIRRKGGGESVDEVLLDERLQMIVDWREAYGAQLYYSSEKMMDESGNFYFVLTFTRDDQNYAIAENPVYGNATYAIAEHLMPLLEGESLLTVVKELRRKSIRSLSGRQIIHKNGPTSHPDKVDAAIQKFAGQTL